MNAIGDGLKFSASCFPSGTWSLNWNALDEYTLIFKKGPWGTDSQIYNPASLIPWISAHWSGAGCLSQSPPPGQVLSMMDHYSRSSWSYEANLDVVSKTKDLDQKPHQWKQSTHVAGGEEKSPSAHNRRGIPQPSELPDGTMHQAKIVFAFIKGIPWNLTGADLGPSQPVRNRKKARWLRRAMTALQMIWKFPGWILNLLPVHQALLRHRGRDLPCMLSRSRSGQWLHPRGQDWKGCPLWKIRFMAPVLCTLMSTGDFGLDPNLIKSINVFWLTAAVFE